MNPIRTILHPTDFSPAAHFAFQMASSLAKDHKAKLIVLHVVPSLFLTNEGMPGLFIQPRPTPEPLDQRFSWPQPADEALLLERRVVENDSITEAILGVAKEVRCDLIVMGTEGRSGFARLLLGSIAEEVVRQSCCPVLTAKALACGAQTQRAKEIEATPDKAVVPAAKMVDAPPLWPSPARTVV